MVSVSQELLQKAIEITEKAFREKTAFGPHWQSLGVVLSGSAPTEYADQYSSVDLVLLCPKKKYEEIKAKLADEGIQLGPVSFEPEAFVEEVADGRRLNYNVYPVEAVREALADYDDLALSVFARAVSLHDPARLVERLEEYRRLPSDVIASKVRYRYQQIRQRQASLAWNLRRGQPFAFLENLLNFLSHAFTVCMLLDGEPPLGRKWLFMGALRTETGIMIRPQVFELFSSLGDVATLGGQFNARKTRIYLLADEIRKAILGALHRRGLYQEEVA